MSFLDELGKFGANALDSIGEGFDNIVDTTTKNNSSVNAKTQPQATHQADNNGNKVTPTNGSNNMLLYVGGGLGVLLLVGIIVVAVK